jgi:hypothetical protein
VPGRVRQGGVTNRFYPFEIKEENLTHKGGLEGMSHGLFDQNPLGLFQESHTFCLTK